MLDVLSRKVCIQSAVNVYLHMRVAVCVDSCQSCCHPCSVFVLCITFHGRTQPIRLSTGDVRLVHAAGDRLYGGPHWHVCCGPPGGRNGGPHAAGPSLSQLEGRAAHHHLHRHHGKTQEMCHCIRCYCIKTQHDNAEAFCRIVFSST